MVPTPHDLLLLNVGLFIKIPLTLSVDGQLASIACRDLLFLLLFSDLGPTWIPLRVRRSAGSGVNKNCKVLLSSGLSARTEKALKILRLSARTVHVQYPFCCF